MVHISKQNVQLLEVIKKLEAQLREAVGLMERFVSRVEYNWSRDFRSAVERTKELLGDK